MINSYLVLCKCEKIVVETSVNDHECPNKRDALQVKHPGVAQLKVWVDSSVSTLHLFHPITRCVTDGTCLTPSSPAGLLCLRWGDWILPGTVLLGCRAAAARELPHIRRKKSNSLKSWEELLLLHSTVAHFWRSTVTEHHVILNDMQDV